MSCLAAIGVWLYFALIFVLILYVDGFTKILSDSLVPESSGISDFRGMGAAVAIFATLFFFIPVAGHLLGLLLGVIGLFRPSRKRLFAYAGVMLNLLPAAVLMMFYFVGALSPR